MKSLFEKKPRKHPFYLLLIFLFSHLLLYVCVFAVCGRDVQSRPHFKWVDNFSHFMSRSVPTMAANAYSSCLWSGTCDFECLVPGLSDAVVVNPQTGVLVPAMPTRLLQHMPSVMVALQYIKDEGWSYYDKSLVKKYDVRNIPLKINTKAYPELATTINSYRLRNVHPTKLDEINIGSNRGLICILKQLHDEHKMGAQTGSSRYVSLNVDENIFWRVLKVHQCVVVFMLPCFVHIS
jgi:hypothetical protein